MKNDGVDVSSKPLGRQSTEYLERLLAEIGRNGAPNKLQQAQRDKIQRILAGRKRTK